MLSVLTDGQIVCTTVCMRVYVQSVQDARFHQTWSPNRCQSTAGVNVSPTRQKAAGTPWKV